MKTIKNNSSETTFVSRGIGYHSSRRGTVASFSVLGMDDPDHGRQDEYHRLYAPYLDEKACLTVGEWYIPVWGKGHNLYPLEVDALVRENKLLPGILRKQEDFLYGHGPYLYREEVEDGRRRRIPIVVPEVERWLAGWEEQGVPPVEDYLHRLIEDYYRVRTCVTQWHMSRGRRLEQHRAGSIRALSAIGADSARLAMPVGTIDPLHRTVCNSDCRYVAIGDWLLPGTREVAFYDRFDPARPWASPAPVSFLSAHTFARRVYAYNDWFEGLREWIRAGNMTPRYLNSYLRNALNAHVHVRIPIEWYNVKKNALDLICQQNCTLYAQGEPYSRLTAEYGGVTLIDPNTHTPYYFNEAMMDDLIAAELDKITQLLSGEGKNQGKLYASTKVGSEGWEFVEFPGKFKDYFDSVISYDKRADQVTLAGIGINSSITNVENDGVISKSGSDVYYNYMVYLNSLSYAEQFVTRELNRAIALNFPTLTKQGVRLGLDIQVPTRQQETTPSDRMDRQPAI